MTRQEDYGNKAIPIEVSHGCDVGSEMPLSMCLIAPLNACLKAWVSTTHRGLYVVSAGLDEFMVTLLPTVLGTAVCREKRFRVFAYGPHLSLAIIVIVE